jgi:hypothetical protein
MPKKSRNVLVARTRAIFHAPERDSTCTYSSLEEIPISPEYLEQIPFHKNNPTLKA